MPVKIITIIILILTVVRISDNFYVFNKSTSYGNVVVIFLLGSLIPQINTLI